MSGPDSPRCDEVEAVSAELALGILTGPERAQALGHVAGCASCRRGLEELSAVGDEILLLGPPREPSIGFESRVMAAAGLSEGAVPMRSRDLPRRRRRSIRTARPNVGPRVATAAVFAVMLGGGGVLAGMALDGPGEAIRTAIAVSANGRATCRAMAYGDKEALVLVTMEAPHEWTADYTLEVTTIGGGAPAAVGSLRLQGGQGSFSTTVDVPAKRLLAVRLLDSSGKLRYEAPFTD